MNGTRVALAILLPLALLSCTSPQAETPRALQSHPEVPEWMHTAGEEPAYADRFDRMTFWLHTEMNSNSEEETEPRHRSPSKRKNTSHPRAASLLESALERVGATVRTDRRGTRNTGTERGTVDLHLSIRPPEGDTTNQLSIAYHGSTPSQRYSADVAGHIASVLTDRYPSHRNANELVNPHRHNCDDAGCSLASLPAPGVLIRAPLSKTSSTDRNASGMSAGDLAATCFRGLNDWIRNGLPDARLVRPAPGDTVHTRKPQIRFRLFGRSTKAGSGDQRTPPEEVALDSIRLYLDGERVQPEVDPATGRIIYTPHSLSNGSHTVRLSFRNQSGNHNQAARRTFTVATHPHRILLLPDVETVPAGPESAVKIRVRMRDRAGLPVASGLPMDIRTSYGSIKNENQSTDQRGNTFYLHGEDAPGTAVVRVRCKGTSETVRVSFRDTETAAIRGRVVDPAGDPISGALCELSNASEKRTTITDRNGYYFFNNTEPDRYRLSVSHTGYYARNTSVMDGAGKTTLVNVTLEPVARGLLHKRHIELEPTGTSTPLTENTSAARASESVAVHLNRLLNASGAEASITRSSDDIPASALRQIRNADPIRLQISLSTSDVERPTARGSFVRNESEERHLCNNLCNYLISPFDNGKIHVEEKGSTPEHDERPSKVRIHLDLPSNLNVQERIGHHHFLWQMAYQLYQGLIDYHKPNGREFRSVKLKLSGESGNPATGCPVTLQDTLTLYTNEDGLLYIPFLNNKKYSFTYNDGTERIRKKLYSGDAYSFRVTKQPE